MPPGSYSRRVKFDLSRNHGIFLKQDSIIYFTYASSWKRFYNNDLSKNLIFLFKGNLISKFNGTNLTNASLTYLLHETNLLLFVLLFVYVFKWNFELQAESKIRIDYKYGSLWNDHQIYRQIFLVNCSRMHPNMNNSFAEHFANNEILLVFSFDRKYFMKFNAIKCNFLIRFRFHFISFGRTFNSLIVVRFCICFQIGIGIKMKLQSKFLLWEANGLGSNMF